MAASFQALQDNKCEVTDYPVKGAFFTFSWDQDDAALDFKVMFDKYTTINRYAPGPHYYYSSYYYSLFLFASA